MLDLINTEKKYKQESLICKRENNDCVVRMFASAFDLKYGVAHKFVEQRFNRKPLNGVRGFVNNLDELKTAFKHSIEPLGEKWKEGLGIHYYAGHRIFNGHSKRRNCVRGFTTGSFIKAYPKGTFIMVVSRHTFTIKDGVIFGNMADAKELKARIENVYRITRLSA